MEKILHLQSSRLDYNLDPAKCIQSLYNLYDRNMTDSIWFMIVPMGFTMQKIGYTMQKIRRIA